MIENPEIKVALSGPAVLANRFVITAGRIIRVAFLETGGDTEPSLRTAVALSPENARELGELLLAAAEKAQSSEAVEASVAIARGGDQANRH
ncbi:MAG: hypothetical protein JWN93_1921 [Hyphomicrobiales bacterium]|nr:hypothetical protein [Hyphomicrobiales bacterium]